MRILYLIPTLSLLSFAWSQAVQSPLPATVPLVLRSPYFNCWNNATFPMQRWPNAWNGQILGWVGHVRVDGQVYQWQGDHNTKPPIANFTNVQVTPTRTIFMVQAGHMNFTFTFLTPIEPTDLVRQSIPFSYLSVDVTSADGQPHSVQVYSDISAEWVSGNRSEIATWNTTKTDSSTYHTVQLQNPTPLTEFEATGQAEDVTVFFAMRSRPDMTANIDTDDNSRSRFATSGSLTISSSPSFGIINSPFYVFAISVDLGNITQTSSPVVWSIGMTRNPAVMYTTPTGVQQPRIPYFLTQYSTTQTLIDAFVSDFEDASQRATTFDQKVQNATSSFTPDYFNLVSLAARQAIGGTELTISTGTDGKFNMSDVKMFMKNVGTDRRVNPVETLYASFPFFLYLNATFAGYLLSPLLEYQDSPQYTQPYAAKDLGPNYPIAMGANAPHRQGVEQSGNMLIMALVHARLSGDGTLIARHYDLLKNWTEYLVGNTLTQPTPQSNADSESQANMTNLIIKGIIGIKAMSEISQALGKQDDSQRYSNISSSFTNTWMSQALSSDGQHVLWDYGDQSSWTQVYNLYADRLLETNVIDNHVYDLQTQYYKQLINSSTPPVATTFGLPIDSSVTTQTNSAWTIFTAAITTDTIVRDSLISPIWNHVAFRNSFELFPTVYKLDPTSGIHVSGISNPAQGAIFAPLALSVSNVSITIPSPSATPSSSGGSGVADHTSIVGPVVGGVIGGVAFLALIALLALFLRRRSQRRVPLSNMVEANTRPPASVHGVTPFDLTQSTSDNAQSTGLITQSSSSTQQVSSLTSPKTWAATNVTRSPLSSRRGPSTLNSRGGGSSGSAPASSRSLPTTTSSSTVSRNDVLALRSEVENLRRVVEGMQVDDPGSEAPPEYASAG